MRKLALIAGLAGCLALPTVAVADSVTVSPNGVTVRDNDHHYDHHYHHHHHHDCRTVTVRDRRPDGSVVVRKSQRCD
ncbi:MAG: hypothetical protein ACRECC_11055 [Pseudolabrys sp.]|jgi:hypothetical protein